jgi:hypothetical protein
MECRWNLLGTGKDLRAHDAKCCAWASLEGLERRNVYSFKNLPNFCGRKIDEGDKFNQPEECCEADVKDCEERYFPSGDAFEQVAEFAKN